MNPNDRDAAMQRDQRPRSPSGITADRPQPSPADLRLDVRAKMGRLWWTLLALGLLALAITAGVFAWRGAFTMTAGSVVVPATASEGDEVPATDDPSIVVIKHRGEDEYKEGIVYDKAVLNVDATQIVVIPDTATVERGTAEGRVEVYMRKHKDEGGFPRPTSDEHIRDTRTYMGCVRRAEDGKLVIASYGEWCGLEQEADERLLIRVPERQTVEARAGLSGTRPVKGIDRYHRSPREQGEEGWEAIAAQPDPARTAARAK